VPDFIGDPGWIAKLHIWRGLPLTNRPIGTLSAARVSGATYKPPGSVSTAFDDVSGIPETWRGGNFQK
jgi:hypothetical protein